MGKQLTGAGMLSKVKGDVQKRISFILLSHLCGIDVL